MPETDLTSMKYLPDDYFSPEAPPQSSASKTLGFIFRCVLIAGVVGTSWWFYENKDQILANIRDNSGNYDYIFQNLVRDVDSQDIQEIDVEKPITNASFSAPLDNPSTTN